jgi:hypothetical protein
MCVKAPFSKIVGQDDKLVQLIFGFAVVDSNRNLVYIRVQDHLRRMGLAQRVVYEMAAGREQLKIEAIRWRALPPDFPEPAEKESRLRVQRMWDAALLSPPDIGTPDASVLS